ncbi:MAG: sulfotransferase [Chitinophagales bacterium]
MAKKEKFEAAISTIAGSGFPVFLRAIKAHTIDPGYKSRLWKSAVVSLIGEPFRWTEKLRYGKKIRDFEIKHDPIFILGHWRSGTTLLHNLIAQDPRMGYVTTYQSVFPNYTLSSRWLWRNMMKLMMPDKRASDNVELSVNYPQEEEFAIGGINSYSYYNWWYFPKDARTLFKQFISFEASDAALKQQWKDDYKALVKKSLINLEKECFVSKNPPNTGRIDTLTEIFPDARFIHIYRNPVAVFISTKKFFTNTIPPLQFQRISEAEMEELIFDVYEMLMRKYLKDRKLLNEQQLIEIRYEDFEKNPLPFIEKIYKQLKIPNFKEAKPGFEKYLQKQKKFVSNKHQLKQETVDKILQRWDFAMKAFNYDVPGNIEIIK